MMRSLGSLLLITLTLATASFGQEAVLLVAPLSGRESVPPSNSVGRGGVEIYYQSVDSCDVALDHEVGVYIGVTDLVGRFTGAYIHAGVEGKIGPRLYTLAEGVLPSRGLSLMLNADHCDLLANGGAYAIIATEDHPDGEIRGQIYEKWHVNPVEGTTWGRIKRRYH